MNRKDLITNDDIWNAMVFLMSEYDFPTDNQLANKVSLVYHYYSELESGGHEALFNWFGTQIEELGASNYFKELTSILEEINAHEYSLIEKEYGEKSWELFKALENNEIQEEAFYEVIEKADTEYQNLNGKLADLLETYFINIHTQLIEIVE